MRKLLFVLAFTFIGQQAFSQMYIVTLSETHQSGAHSVCTGPNQPQPFLTIVEPSGNIQYVCLSTNLLGINSYVLGEINQALNNIINQGYKLIETNDASLVSNSHYLAIGKTWYFAIP